MRGRKAQFMKSLMSITYILLFSSFQLLGQANFFSLKTKLLTADSAIIISYESPADSIQGLEYLLNKKDFFTSIVKKKHFLTKTQLDTLSNILTRGDRILGRKTTTKYFKPRQGILIYRSNLISYIDICFSCKRIETSKDIQFDDFDIGAKKWDDMKRFFIDLRVM
jgi:hypothetical protein